MARSFGFLHGIHVYALMVTASVKIKSSTRSGGKDKDQKESSYTTCHVASNLPPMHGASQAATRGFKAERLLVQAIRAFHQELQPFSSFQNSFNILDHDSLHVINLALDGPNIVDCLVGFFGIEEIHPLLDDPRKFFIVSKRNGMLGFFSAVFCCKLIFHVVQKGVRDSVLVVFIAHAEEANSVLHNVVEKILIVHIRLASIFGRNLREQDATDSWEVTSG